MSISSLTYAPPQVRPSWKLTSYLTVGGWVRRERDEKRMRERGREMREREGGGGGGGGGEI